MATLSEENYLKAIFHLTTKDNMLVSTNSIAKKMKTKASSATDMIKKLSDKGHVDYLKYKGVNLTEKGRLAAISVIRKHRLWEVFLVKKLNFSWDEVHIVAEQLEHIKSKKLIKELDAFLDFPSEDPHGDPIPNSEGEMPNTKRVLLSMANPGDNCICVGVKDSSASFLQYLDRYKITLGTQISVISKEPFDESMLVIINSGRNSISKEVANNILIKIK
jgi:DtxR family Mn-dependent transcriptional regulator